jgi:hypothetical protein
MSFRRKKAKLNHSRQSECKHDEEAAVYEAMRPNSSTSGKPMAVSSSLNSIHISPRTPKTPKTPRMGLDDAEEGVELTLLGEEERHQASRGLDDAEDAPSNSKRAIGAKDKRGMVLLCVLCRFFCFEMCSLLAYRQCGIRPYSRSSCAYQFNISTDFARYTEIHV